MIKAGIPIADDTGFFFDGTKLIVHNSPRIIQRIRDLLRRYDDENTQVEIEAKFLKFDKETWRNLASIGR